MESEWVIFGIGFVIIVLLLAGSFWNGPQKGE